MKGVWIILLFIFLVACAKEINEEKVEVQPVVSPAKIDPKANCANECINDGCVDSDYYLCKIIDDGCNYFVKAGPTLGKCDIGCFNSYDCPFYQDCTENVTKYRVEYKCVNISDDMVEARKRNMESGLDYR